MNWHAQSSSTTTTNNQDLTNPSTMSAREAALEAAQKRAQAHSESLSSLPLSVNISFTQLTRYVSTHLIAPNPPSSAQKCLETLILISGNIIQHKEDGEKESEKFRKLKAKNEKFGRDVGGVKAGVEVLIEVSKRRAGLSNLRSTGACCKLLAMTPIAQVDEVILLCFLRSSVSTPKPSNSNNITSSLPLLLITRN